MIAERHRLRNSLFLWFLVCENVGSRVTATACEKPEEEEDDYSDIHRIQRVHIGALCSGHCHVEIEDVSISKPQNCILD